MKAKDCFIGLNSRNVLGHVGRFGEDLIASLFAGDVVSQLDGESYPFADVVNLRASLACQVKMCNGRHAQRPLPDQVLCLSHEVGESSFLFKYGCYAFVFYCGVHATKARAGKSKIWSRKFSRTTGREIIAHELQYIYLLDAELLGYMVRYCPQLLKKNAIVYDPDRKPQREEVLYLNRTFLKGFSKRSELHLNMLRDAHGGRHWAVKTSLVEMNFLHGAGGPFGRMIPVHIVGSRKIVGAISKVLEYQLPVSLGTEVTPVLRVQGTSA